MAIDIQLAETQIQGFNALTLTNPFLSLTVIPDLGGKISNIFDRRSQREWLWTNAALPYRRLPTGSSYIRYADTGGWDECFPTVAACTYPLEPWHDARLPDHGELWSQAWPFEILSVSEEAIAVRTEAQGVALPYRFQRTITLNAHDPLIRLDYHVQNLAEAPLAWIWSAHPLLAVEAGMQVQLPDDARMRVWQAHPPTIIPQATEELYWPVVAQHQGKLWDLRVMPEADARFACKLWSQPLSQGNVALVAHDGALRLSFDPALLPQVGLWVNAGAWSGTNANPYYNLALEPCIGAQDSLKQAIEVYHQHALLPPHGERAWWLEVHLDAKGALKPTTIDR